MTNGVALGNRSWVWVTLSKRLASAEPLETHLKLAIGMVSSLSVVQVQILNGDVLGRLEFVE